MANTIIIRQLSSDDSIEELTSIIRSAYFELGQRGWNFNGVNQSVEGTVQRAGLGVCLVANVGAALIGTITVHGPFPTAPCQHLMRDDVAYFQQFAVHPKAQQSGIGGKLLEQAEACARLANYRWISTDTATEALDQLAFYSRRGYAPVADMQWPGKTYRSVVLSKAL